MLLAQQAGLGLYELGKENPRGPVFAFPDIDKSQLIEGVHSSLVLLAQHPARKFQGLGGDRFRLWVPPTPLISFRELHQAIYSVWVLLAQHSTPDFKDPEMELLGWSE